jgi:stearoyl-CoA desaturase (delta-9 desaturase)
MNDHSTTACQHKHAPTSHAPIFRRFSDLFKAGFSIDWGIAAFLIISHGLVLILTPLAYVYAPAGLWKVMLAWTLVHALIAAIATTAYSHRLIAHRAAKDIRLPTHIVFLGLQLFALQGSVRRWSAQHVIHHAVDKTGQHHLDPYSTTWFDTGWRNFLWSHMLTYLFNHPDSREFDAAMNAKMHPAIIWQDKHYVPLLILANFVLPIALGIGLAGWLGGFCLLVASSGGYVLAHHNTWTVNSVTHMWGFKKGLISSAKNNYIWLGPLGEGNHHADHHDHPRDFRNGFGWTGWVLDPTRYVILSLRAMGLVKGLNRASRWQEAQIITRRKVRDTKAKSQSMVWQRWEDRLALLGDEWLAAAQTWDQFKLEKIRLTQQIRQAGADKMAAARERMGVTHEELLLDLRVRREAVRTEMQDARKRLKAKREAFFTALSELKQANMSVA